MKKNVKESRIEGKLITIALPWPPTANHYWKRNANNYFISTEGRVFRELAYYECLPYKKSELYDKRLSLFICAFPPDKRRRDLDNLMKCLLDSLQYSEIYKDDSQIDCIYIKRMPELLGQVIVKIEEFKP